MGISGGFAVDQLNPSGAVQMYAGTQTPNGWLLCDGSAVSRTIYSTLYSVIGTTYGAGDGSTTFNLPNLQGRVAVGKNNGTFNTLGKTGGEETHTLSVSEMPSHSHQIVANSETSGSYTGIAQSGGTYGNSISWTAGYIAGGLWGTDTGGGSAHNNLQPYMTLNFIIKA